MSYGSLKSRTEAIEILKNYNGKNPYILSIKIDVYGHKDFSKINDFSIEYILKNYNREPRIINKVIKIADWYAKKKVEEKSWDINVIPERIQIVSYWGETDSTYHCYIKYKQNMTEPKFAWIPKKAVLTEFLLEDYHNISVDFDRYDRLSQAKDPNRIIKGHQKEAVQFLLSRKKCILADDQGLGKTLSLSVAAIEGNFDSVLIICPASLKSNWKNELLWYVPERDITIVEGIQGKTKGELEKYLGYAEKKSGLSVSELQKEAKEKGKWIDNRFVIINYDILDEVYQIPETRSKENIDKAYLNSPMLQYIKNKKALIIIDESHKLSNIGSNRYNVIRDLIKRGNPDSLYLATGTPITNNPQNFYNLLQLIGADIANDWNYYMQRYCGAIKIPKNAAEKEKRNQISQRYCREHHKSNWYDLTDEEKTQLNEIVEKNCKMMTIAKDATNLEELRDRTSHIYLRRVKEDLKGLPPKYIHERVFELTSEQQNEYDKLWEEYENAKLIENPLQEINKDLLEGAVYRKYLSNQMVPHTIELVDRCLAKNEKVIIACCYDEELYTLRDYYGDKCVIYNGKLSAKEKDIAKEKFMTDPNVMVFIGNIISAGVGLTLTVSRVMVFNNLDYVAANCNQMQDRIHRIGQNRDCHIYYQYFKNTQYEKIWNTVLKKQLITDTIIKKESDK